MKAFLIFGAIAVATIIYFVRVVKKGAWRE